MRRFAIFLLALVIAVLVSQELSLSLPMFGVGPDLLIVVALAFAIGERPAVAAGYGYAAGLLRDLLLSSPTGLSAFVYAVTAYPLGWVGNVRGVWVLIGTIAGGTFVSQVLYGLGAQVLSQNAELSTVPRVALLTTLYDALLAPLIIPVIRRFVAPDRAAAVRGTTEA